MNIAVYLFHSGADRPFTSGTFASSRALAAALLKRAPFESGFLLVSRFRFLGKTHELRVNFAPTLVLPVDLAGECEEIARAVMDAAIRTIKRYRPELLHVSQ